jgi:hypothetical protein
MTDNPKAHPTDNAEKPAEEWVTGEEPMTGAQASYLKTLSEQHGRSDAFADDLTKAEASKRIDALKGKGDEKVGGAPASPLKRHAEM